MLAEVVRVPEEVGHPVPQRVHEAKGKAGSEDAVPRVNNLTPIRRPDRLRVHADLRGETRADATLDIVDPDIPFGPVLDLDGELRSIR